MPQVPVFGEPQVAPQAMPGARVSPDASAEVFGGGAPLARLQSETSELSTAYARLMRFEKLKADNEKNLDAAYQINQTGESLYKDAKTGFLNQNFEDGDSALKAHQTAMDALKAKGDEMLGKAQNESQRLYIRHYMLSVTDHYNNLGQDKLAGIFKGLADKHSAAQKQQFTNGAVDQWRHMNDPPRIIEAPSEIKEAFSDNPEAQAALAASPVAQKLMHQEIPNPHEEQIQKLRDMVEQDGKLQGHPKDFRDAEAFELVSNARLQTIKNAVDSGDDVGAKAYFDKHQEEIDAKGRPALEKMLREGSVRREASTYATAIWQPGANLKDALTDVDKIKDPEVKLATEKLIRQQDTAQKTANDEADKDAYRQTSNRIEAIRLNNPNAVIDLHSGSNAMLRPSEWLSLSPESRKKLEKEVANDDAPENSEQYYKLLMEASNPQTREAFLKRDLMKDTSGVNAKQTHELMEMQGKLMAGEDKAIDRARQQESRFQIMKDSLALNGIVDEKKAAMFHQRFGEELKTWEDEHPAKKADEDVMRGISDKLMIESKIHRTFLWDKTVRAFERPKPSREDTERIRQFLKSKGQPTDDDSIQTAYEGYLAAKSKAK